MVRVQRSSPITGVEDSREKFELFGTTTVRVKYFVLHKYNNKWNLYLMCCLTAIHYRRKDTEVK